MAVQFQFKDYIFPINPNRFRISRGRVLKTFQPPMAGAGVVRRAVIQPIGLEPVVITGTGELAGEDPMAEYVSLYQLFLQEGSGLLTLPGLTPFYCYFQSLQLTGEAGPNVLGYEFSFLEDCEKNSAALEHVPQYYVCRSGDTLCLAAVKCGVSVEELRSQNPALDAADELEEGTILWL